MFLSISDLSVHYKTSAGDRRGVAVDRVSFDLQAGDIGVLLGPSGCGKTSLLRAIAGLEPLAAGFVSIAGRRVADANGVIDDGQRRIGMVFQDYALFPHLTVAANVAYGLHRLPATQRTARVHEVLALVELQASADRYPHQLSGGQQQRVALARALAPKPDLLLLDEPFSSLDVDLRERLSHELRSILKRAGATALLVTHDQQEAFAMGDLIGVMRKGQLHQWGNAYSIYHEPHTRFVAEFIGDGVFLPATVQEMDGARMLETPLGRLPLDADSVLPTGGICDVLMRADDIIHVDEAPTKATILRKAFRGAEFLYTLRLGSGHEVLALVPSHHDHQVGEPIGIEAVVDHVVAFPAPPSDV
jgi:iron(III) transport system ATP-binding protein